MKKFKEKRNGGLNEKNIQGVKELSLQEMREINGGKQIPIFDHDGNIMYYIDIE